MNQTEKVITLDTDLCYGNPNQPRQYFNIDALKELAESIKESGQLQPGKVRPDGKGKYMIVMGERRWRACKMAGVPYKAIVVDIDDETLALQAIIENEQRADVTPIESAKAYKQQIDAGMALKDLTKKIGKRPSFIQSRIDLLKLSKVHQMALNQGGLSIGQANQLVRLSQSGQNALVKMIDSGKVKSYKDVCNAADAILQAEQQSGFQLMPPPKPLSKKEIGAMSRVEKAIEKVTLLIQKGFTKNGEIIIHKLINPKRALNLADKIALIKKHLNYLENDLRKGAMKAQIGGNYYAT